MSELPRWPLGDREHGRTERWKQRPEVLWIDPHTMVDDDDRGLPERGAFVLREIRALTPPVEELTESERHGAPVGGEVGGGEHGGNDGLEIVDINAHDVAKSLLDFLLDLERRPGVVLSVGEIPGEQQTEFCSGRRGGHRHATVPKVSDSPRRLVAGDRGLPIACERLEVVLVLHDADVLETSIDQVSLELLTGEEKPVAPDGERPERDTVVEVAIECVGRGCRDHHGATRVEATSQLAQKRLRIIDMLDHLDGDDDVEVIVVGRQGRIEHASMNA